MVFTEDKELEKAVLSRTSCVAVPIEVLKDSSGEISCVAYSFCKKEAEEFEELFGDDIFSGKAAQWASEHFDPIMNGIGYFHQSHEGEMMLEYELCDPSVLPETKEVTPVMISSNDELRELCLNTGCSIEINDDGEDILFAVVENGKILSYAGMNDILYDDGSVEISVETASEHRRKGYGIACVSALSKHILNFGSRVKYKCSLFNKPSSALAEKCGFSLAGKRYSYVCYLDEDN